MAAREHLEQALRALQAERTRLDAERERTDSAIRLLEAALAEWPPEPKAAPTEPKAAPTEPAAAPAGPYTDMELIDAAHAALTELGDLSNADLAHILLSRGFRTRAQPELFAGTVRAMMKKIKAWERGIRKSEDGLWTIRPRS